MLGTEQQPASKGNEVSSERHENFDQYWVKYVEDKYNSVRSFRSPRIEQQWMINMAYYKGIQNLRYRVSTRQIIWDATDPLKFYVNYTMTAVRAIRAAVTRYQPQWDVDAQPYGILTVNDTRLLGGYLASLHDKLKLKQKIKEAVMFGLIYGLGIFQYGFDPDADGGEGELWVETLDPFDVYIDPSATSLTDARFVIKVVRRPVDYIKANKNYQNTEDLKPDNQFSSSEYKNLLESRQVSDLTSDDTVLLKEAMCRTQEGIRVITIAGGRVLRNELTDYDELPYCLYQPDINPKEIYSEGWVKNIVPINKAINQLEKAILEFNVVFSKGKYITDSNNIPQLITNENGQIIKKAPGAQFEQMDIKPMSSTPFNQLQNLQRYFQDVSAVQDALLGRTPPGVTAAVAIETLVANNMNSISDLIDNLEICLSDLGEKLLKTAYKYQNNIKRFKMYLGNGQTLIGKVGGKDALFSGDSDEVKLPGLPEVKVRIVSGLAYTKTGKQDLFFRLRQQGDVDRKTLLEELDLDAEEINARIQEEQGQVGAQANPAPEDAAGEDPVSALEAELAAQGLTLDPKLKESPELILKLINKEIEPTITEDGVFTIGMMEGG